MIPKKIIFYTRAVQVHFHIELARRYQAEFPNAKVLFISFFSHAVEIAREAGFEAVHSPKAMQTAGERPISDARMDEIDAFCIKEYEGLNTMLQMERFLPEGREAAKDFMIRHLTVLDELIEENTLSISSMYDHFFYVVAGMLAFEKNGAHFAFVGCGVPSGRVIGLKTPRKVWKNTLSEEDPALLLEKTKSEVELPPEERIIYMKAAPVKTKVSFFKRIRLAKQIASYNKRDYQEGSYFIDMQRSWMHNALYWRYQRLVAPKSALAWDIRTTSELTKVSGPCVLLALHMEPEATILMYSPRWRDQLEICRLVAEALPVEFTLLVKEHPRMVNKRASGYYDAIKRFTNVRLVSAAVSSNDLVEKSVAVVSLAGTVTLEARLRGKLAFCFGRPPYHRIATACGEQLLDHLNSLTSNPPLDLMAANDGNWADWIQGTFVGHGGKSKYSEELGYMVWGDDEQHVDAHFRFIQGALS